MRKQGRCNGVILAWAPRSQLDPCPFASGGAARRNYIIEADGLSLSPRACK